MCGEGDHCGWPAKTVSYFKLARARYLFLHREFLITYYSSEKCCMMVLFPTMRLKGQVQQAPMEAPPWDRSLEMRR